MSVDFTGIQNAVNDIGRKLDVPKDWLHIFDSPTNDGAPYIIIDESEFHYVLADRGYEISRKTVSSLDDLLYLIFDRITSKAAIEYELSNRVSGQDSRRIYFGKKIEMMRCISNDWGLKSFEEINGILRSSPFIDNS